MPRFGIILAIIASIFLAACTPADEAPPTVGASSVADQPIALDWKLAEGETIAYHTAVTPLDNPSFELNWDEFFIWEESSNDEGSLADVAHRIQEGLSGALSDSVDYGMVSVLKPNEQGNVTVLMILDSLDFSADETDTTSETPPESTEEEDWQQQFTESIRKMQQDMIGTVQLRGEVAPTGEVTSFYLSNRQKNLLALFFEIPSHAVRVGDEWEIEFDCLEVGAGFIVKDANRLNQVTFSEVTTLPDGRRVAVLDYLLVESISGHSDSQMLANMSSATTDQIPVSMQCSFIGQGQFLIDEGRWHQFVGEMTINSDGFMMANSVQAMALVPMETVPPQYIGLE